MPDGFDSNVFLEFGGYTGELSNSEYMMKKYNSFGVFIEGDHENCLKLKDYMKNYKSLVLEDFVEAEKPNTLENILIKNNINFNIDLLSIDIDGNDYWILNSLDKLKPRVIISSKPNKNELEALPFFYGFTGKKVDKKDYVKTDNIIIWDNFIVEKIANN